MCLIVSMLALLASLHDLPRLHQVSAAVNTYNPPYLYPKEAFNDNISQLKCLLTNHAGVQAAIGSNMLQLPATFSQLAHSVHSLAALNTVPGNSYSYARPSKPQLTGGVTSSASVAPVARPSGTPPLSVSLNHHICISSSGPALYVCSNSTHSTGRVNKPP